MNAKLSCFARCLLIYLNIFLLILVFQRCKKEDSIKSFNKLDLLVGEWIIGYATLDDSLRLDWSNMFLFIERTDTNRISLTRSNRKGGSYQIWPENSLLDLTFSKKDSVNSKTIFEFNRNDGIEVVFAESEPGSWDVFVQTPRDWSYEEECPIDSSQVFCQNQGKWMFKAVVALVD